MASADYQDSVLAEPTLKPITWRGQDVTSSRVVEIFGRNWEMAAWRNANVIQARGSRRKELTVALSPTWAAKNPEVAKWAKTVMSERQTIEREQIARVNAVLPTFNREALDHKKLSDDEAGECERYMNEWRQQKLDQEEFGVKGVEDGEWGLTIVPAKDDMGGRPDFYDRITEEAYKKLPHNDRKEYQKDSGDTRGRYARMGEDGHKSPHQKWDRNAAGKSRKDAGDDFTRDDKKSEDAHTAALDQYLLQHDASTVRLIPALDCVPIYSRGTGKERFKLIAIIERSLVSIEEALEMKLGWVGMGNRAMIPRGYRENRSTGQNGDYYLYTLHTTSTDDEGIEHPLMFYCLGGYGTWSTGAASSGKPDDKKSVAMIDLFQTHGLSGRYFGYFGGMRTGDDEPLYRFQPWMYPFIDAILSLEGGTTALKALIGTSAYPWWNYKPDAALGALDDESLMETGADGKRVLRKPQTGRPGEVVTNPGDMIPQQPAMASPDAWRMNQSEVIALQQNTATERPNAASGNAIAMSETLAQVNQAQVRKGMSDATQFAGECHLKILDAAHERWEVDWPLNTTMKRSAGVVTGSTRGSTKVARFDPAWLGDGEVKNYKLSVVMPKEANLARIDLTRSLKLDGLATFADVQDDRGKEDSQEVRLEIAKDQLWEDPVNKILYQQRVAQITGNKKAQAILKLKADQLMGGGDDQGLPDGVPKQLLGGNKQPQGGGGNGASSVTAQRAGIQGGQVGTATAQQALTSQMGVQAGSNAA